MRIAVSYTHLDVYKRQPCTLLLPLGFAPSYNYDGSPLLPKKKIKLNKTKYSKKIQKKT